MDLLKTLIVLSEKAANIARACRRDDHLFGLLVEQKKDGEANPRFVQDFKTLADVLIQEMVRHFVKNQFCELSNSIRGEENNVFTNKLGEKICVEIKDTEEQTADLLKRVLNGDQTAAKLLAAEVHRNLDINQVDTKMPTEEFDIDIKKLGIWIDPIDCTAEYVSGGRGVRDHNIYRNGLECVTILIGVYCKNEGTPVIGVINRPFMEKNDESSQQQCIWGVSVRGFASASINVNYERKNVICLSNSESVKIKEKLKENGFQLVEAAGAGYKILTVILGLSDVYLLTKGTTYKWDTCAPHAILRATGGDILDFLECVINEENSIDYTTKGADCNMNGIIVYRGRDVLDQVVEIIKM